MSRFSTILVLRLVLALTLAMSSSAAFTQGIVINEFMAQNARTLADDAGEYDDWIELYNPTSQAIDVGGMYLTDNLDSPKLWQIPTGRASLTTIAAHGYLLVWADGGTTGSRLHATFQLASEGDTIGLFDKDGTTLIDSVVFSSQRPDVSYGRDPDGSSQWRYFATPTPGKANTGAFLDVVADPVLSHDRGFFDTPFSLTMTCKTPEALIVYTLDGSVPCDLTGRFSATAQVYAEPLQVSTTTCVRAVAYKPGWMPTKVRTETYIFVSEVIKQTQQQALAAGYPSSWGGYGADYEMDPEIWDSPDYRDQMAEALLSIPTLSIVTDRQHLFGSSGIYSNPQSEGTATDNLLWERPTSVEMFCPQGLPEFQVDCGLRLQGGASRQPMKCPKHSFSLRFRGLYGPTSLNYDLFPGSPVKSFNSLQVRGGFNNAWTHWAIDQRHRAQYIRDNWARDTLIEMGSPDAGYGRSVHVYLNGMYWGMYMLHERSDASQYVAYWGGDKDRLDQTNGDPTFKGSEPGQLLSGTMDAWLELQAAVNSRNWDQIQKALDVDEFIDWTILNYTAGATDLKCGNNWRAVGGGPDRRPWRIYSWDAEKILEDNVNQTTLGQVQDPTRFFVTLCNIEEFRVRFGDRVHKHLFNNGALTVERNTLRWLARSDTIESAVIAESARWGDYRRDIHQYQSGPYELYTKNDHWTPEKNRLLNTYFPARTAIAINLFRSFQPMALYPSVGAPVFNINGVYKHGGRVTATDRLTMTLPQGTTGKIYYTLDGSDPRKPTPGGSDATLVTLAPAGAAKRVLVPTAAVNDAWKGGAAFDDSAWTAVTGNPGGVGFDLNPSGGGDYRPYISCDLSGSMSGKNGSCFIRVPFTVSAADLPNLNSLTLKVQYDDGFVAYLNGTELYRSGFTGTPAWNSRANASHAGGTSPSPLDVTALLGELVAGENLLAIQGLNSSVTSDDVLILAGLDATKLSSPGSTTVPAGVVEYKGAVTLGRSALVRARVQSGVSWSALNEATYGVGPVAASLRISEIMYHPQDTGNPNDPNTEFIELTNVGGEAIGLNLVRFSKGIDFTFGDVVLQAHGYVLVVRDVAAFTAKYGLGLAVAGAYTGSLDNAGERISLEDATGQVIADFEYKDGWTKSTDGQGYSLVVKSPETVDSEGMSDKASWRASSTVGGSPGRADEGL